jgi:hypothetical protein
MVGDATFFHFIAVQMQMGALPYRDIVDIQMPLMYLIHAAIVATIGMSDVAWRVFDVAAATVMAGLILMLVCPLPRRRGRSADDPAIVNGREVSEVRGPAGGVEGESSAEGGGRQGVRRGW